MAELFDSAMAGVGIVLGIQITLAVTNVLTSYLLPGGATLSEYLDSKLNLNSGVGA